MEKLHRTRITVAQSEKVTVWYSSGKVADINDAEDLSIECPYCGEKAFRLELEASKEPEIKIYRDEP